MSDLPWLRRRDCIHADPMWIACLVWLARWMTPPDNRTERKKRP